MKDTQLLVGSLSNDLFRVATLAHRGSDAGAMRFLAEAKRWAAPLAKRSVSKYIADIARDISAKDSGSITPADAEKYLMYGILLQNYALHNN